MLVCPVFAAGSINPPVVGEPWQCKFFLTEWLCPKDPLAGPQGPQGQQGKINLTPNLTAGPPGMNGTVGGTGGQILYFHHLAAPDITGYEGLFPTPAGATEVDESVTVQNGLGNVIVDPYVTDAGYPGVTVLPAGLWRFRTYHYVSSATGTTQAVFNVVNRTSTGTETLLFCATSEDINSLTATEYLTSYVQTANYQVASTDRIVIRVFGTSTHAAPVTFHFVYEGTTHTSHVLTPLVSVAGTCLGDSNCLYALGRPGGQTLTGSSTTGGLTLKGNLVNDSSVLIVPYGGSLDIGQVPSVNTIVKWGTENITLQPASMAGYAYLSASNGGIQYQANRGRGTVASPLPVLSTDRLGVYSFSGYDSSSFTTGANIQGYASQDWNAVSHGGELRFFTKTINTNTAVERVRITENGRVVIGTIGNGSAQLDVASSIRFRNCSGTPTFDAGGNLTCASDEKLKTKIVPFTDSITKLKLINPISWDWNPSSGYVGKSTGFSAQNVQSVLPQAVIARDDVKQVQEVTKGKAVEEDIVETKEVKLGTQTLSIDQTVILATAINAIKEQQTTIEAQQKEIGELKARLDKAGIK